MALGIEGSVWNTVGKVPYYSTVPLACILVFMVIKVLKLFIL